MHHTRQQISSVQCTITFIRTLLRNIQTVKICPKAQHEFTVDVSCRVV